jgi:ABC-type branched-subunit amino acid transport system substrate-binding protein
MTQFRSALVASLVLVLVGLAFLPGAAPAAKTVYVGGTMSLTGPYAEDSAAILRGFEDYLKYVNETKNLAPWRKDKWPADVTIDLLWRDDELKPAKAISIYEELKAKGILVYRVSGSPTALALKDKLKQDEFGATSQAVGPYLLTPPGTIFSNTPLYTDELGAIADWFLENWKEKRKPRGSYLTADNAFGKSIEVPKMEAYLKNAGYEFAGSQYVPLVSTSPPTTQLMRLKEDKVDLALGAMVNPGAQPTIKEAGRLDMGPNLGYKITFGFSYPCIIDLFREGMDKLGDGVVVGGSFPSWTEDQPGVKFALDLQKKYRPNKPEHNTMYMEGLAEVMTQVEALRLAMEKTAPEKLKPADVLNNGFYQIKNLDTGGLTNTPLNYGPGHVEGVDKVRLDQVRNGKQFKLGAWPLHNIF